jgi:hypothetical protein
MPGYLVNGHRDDPLPIPGTDRTVTFKSMASYGDDLAADVAAGQAPAGPLRTRVYILERTVRMIAAWDLEDAEGDPLPITAASLELLSKEVGNFLVAEGRLRFVGREGEEERLFQEALASAISSGVSEHPEVISLLRIRRLAKEFGWTPSQVLEMPAQMVRDLLTAGSFEGQIR